MEDKEKMSKEDKELLANIYIYILKRAKKYSPKTANSTTNKELGNSCAKDTEPDEKSTTT